NIRIISEDDPTDYFNDDLDPNASADVTQSKDFTTLYNSDMYLGADDSLLTNDERDDIKNNLHLNAVHNQLARATLIANLDNQSRSLQTPLTVNITGLTSDIFATGSHIQGTATVVGPFSALYRVQISLLNTSGVTVANTATQIGSGTFDFVVNSPGR